MPVSEEFQRRVAVLLVTGGAREAERSDPRAFVRATHLPVPKLTVDASDGPVVLRLAE